MNLSKSDTVNTILTLKHLPLCIGATTSPKNPGGLPDTFPLALSVNESIGRLEQVVTEELEALLTAVYSLGIEMGTPSDNTDLGKPYVDDFVRFIQSVTPMKGRVLEIGAGVGYLSKVLKDLGWEVDSIEPGKGYADSWKKYGLEVFNEFFPSPRAKGPYDLIVFYTVLEHIKDTTTFLRQVADHLSSNGKIVLGVPNCTSEIESGDPAMLLHEHFQYFTKSTLSRTLQAAGLNSYVTESGYGRCLYAQADLLQQKKPVAFSSNEIISLSMYGETASKVLTVFEDNLKQLCDSGSVGIYCPSRALNVLPIDANVRFFDDSSIIQGKYYAPFQARVESRAELIQKPTDSLIIMSRTFGPQLKSQLQDSLPNVKILLFEEILNEVNND